MVASIRTLANCIGVTPPFSVLGDFFGFARRRLPRDPTGAAVQVSSPAGAAFGGGVG